MSSEVCKKIKFDFYQPQHDENEKQVLLVEVGQPMSSVAGERLLLCELKMMMKKTSKSIRTICNGQTHMDNKARATLDTGFFSFRRESVTFFFGARAIGDSSRLVWDHHQLIVPHQV